VFPLSEWEAAFQAIGARSVVKALLDPRPRTGPPDEKGAR
jgi:hypothetical protein